MKRKEILYWGKYFVGATCILIYGQLNCRSNSSWDLIPYIILLALLLWEPLK